MNRLPRHLSALALFPTGRSRPDTADSARPLIGDTRTRAAAILSHWFSPGGTITFSLRCKSLAADEPEGELANWLEDELTLPGLIVSYGLYNGVMPLLQSLIRPGQHYSLSDITAAPPSRVEDLSRPPGSFTPTLFENVCAQEGIEVVRTDTRRDQELFEASQTSSVDAIVLSRAVATWRLWLSDFAMSTGEYQLCDHAAACLDAELRLNPLPLVDAVGSPFPIF